MLKFFFSGADGVVAVPETLTSGMVGKEVCFSFSDEWKGLSKVAVFSAGNVIRDVVLNESVIIIPAEVLQTPMRYLYVGVYGVSADGALVIPTIRVKGPFIEAGTDPSGDTGSEPGLAVWAQILASIGDLGELNTQSKETLVSAINELAVQAQAMASIGDVGELNTQSKDTLVEAINELASNTGAGLTETEKNLMLSLFKHIAYTSDVSQTIDQLDALWGGAEDGSGGEIHTHSYSSTVTKAATCTTVGVRTYTCSCGESYTEAIPATGHSYVDGICYVCGAEDPDYVPDVTLTGISAAYSGGNVEEGTALSDLTGIVVTAFYSDGSSGEVTGYTLSGVIAEGSNTITVSYGGMTATFTVTGATKEEEYTVTNVLSNVTTDNAAASVTENAAYTATLTAASGYSISTVTVTMGGVDVTSSVYAGGIVSILNVTGDVVITASAAALQSGLLYNWDLTSSLTDTISGVTATLAGSAAQDANGLSITGTNGSCYFGDSIFLPGRTVEVDVSAADMKTSGHGFFIMIGMSNSAANGLGTEGVTFRWGSNWQLYVAGAWHTPAETITDSSIIAGRTVRLCSTSETEFETYFGDTLMGIYSGTAAHKTQLQIGSNGNAFYNLTVTAVRVYGEVA